MASQASIADARSEVAQGDAAPLATARSFAEAIMANDPADAVALLAPAVRFRHLIPKGPREIWGADETVDVFLAWFGGARELEVQSLLVDAIADRTSMRYRVRLHGGSGWEVIEQQQFLDMDDAGRIAAIDLLCSGFRPDIRAEEVDAMTMHRFDAGTMGCADGLAREFRARILSIPVGDLLEVQTIDPAAKEDLPPLARLMGHAVRSVESPGDGRLLITVERGR
jgi:TusA-related sulfurtransferase